MFTVHTADADATQLEFRRDGVGGVYWALGDRNTPTYHRNYRLSCKKSCKCPETSVRTLWIRVSWVQNVRFPQLCSRQRNLEYIIYTRRLCVEDPTADGYGGRVQRSMTVNDRSINRRLYIMQRLDKYWRIRWLAPR